MSFLHPEFLYFMLPPLFILFGFLLTQKETQAQFFSDEVMERLRVGTDTLTLKARNALFLLMGFFMIIALAQPVIKDAKINVKAKSVDIMIAIDISDSMLASDLYPNRLEAAKQKILTLLAKSPMQRVGIVAFAKNSYLLSPLSFDSKAVSFLLSGLNTSFITEKGTDFLSVLDVIGKDNEKNEKKYLLILSDGGDKRSFEEEIKLAKKYNISVFVLGTATKKGSPVKLEDGTFIKEGGDILISKLNEEISELSIQTGGVYIEATTSSNDIEAMLKEIESLAQKKELKSQEIQKHTPLFYYPLIVALIILLIATSSLKRSASMLWIFALFFNPLDTKASILDFTDLKKAKESYENREFETSAKLYKKYADESLKPEAYFNAANAYYKDQKYKEAIDLYNKALFKDDDKKAQNLSNLGNAYAKNADLQQAKESYENSLLIKEDKHTRENLTEVEKLLQKQKEESKKEDKNSQNDKKKKDDSKDGGKKVSSKDESSKENKDKKSDEEADQKEQKKKSGSGDSKERDKKDPPKEPEKNDQNSSKGSDSHAQKAEESSKMSDAEQQKWIEQLKGQNSTYLYRLNDEKSEAKRKNEKPW